MKKPTFTRVGTAYFRDKQAAIEYYTPYYEDAETTVNRMLADKEIYLGCPDMIPGSGLALDLTEGRYFRTYRNEERRKTR